MDDLIAFWRTRLYEAERRACEVLSASMASRAGGLASTLWDEEDERARHELREVAADRAILALLEQPVVNGRERDYDATEALEQVARIRVAVWSDHPDYRQEWASAG